MNNNKAILVLRGNRSTLLNENIKNNSLEPGLLLYNSTDRYLTIGSIIEDTNFVAEPITVREVLGFYKPLSLAASNSDFGSYDYRIKTVKQDSGETIDLNIPSPGALEIGYRYQLNLHKLGNNAVGNIPAVGGGHYIRINGLTVEGVDTGHKLGDVLDPAIVPVNIPKINSLSLVTDDDDNDTLADTSMYVNYIGATAEYNSDEKRVVVSSVRRVNEAYIDKLGTNNYPTNNIYATDIRTSNITGDNIISPVFNPTALSWPTDTNKALIFSNALVTRGYPGDSETANTPTSPSDYRNALVIQGQRKIGVIDLAESVDSTTIPFVGNNRGGAHYAYMLGYKGYGDPKSGGPAHELAFASNGDIFHRFDDLGNGSSTVSWKDFEKLVTISKKGFLNSSVLYIGDGDTTNINGSVFTKYIGVRDKIEGIDGTNVGNGKIYHPVDTAYIRNIGNSGAYPVDKLAVNRITPTHASDVASASARTYNISTNGNCKNIAKNSELGNSFDSFSNIVSNNIDCAYISSANLPAALAYINKIGHYDIPGRSIYTKVLGADITYIADLIFISEASSNALIGNYVIDFRTYDEDETVTVKPNCILLKCTKTGDTTTDRFPYLAVKDPNDSTKWIPISCYSIYFTDSGDNIIAAIDLSDPATVRNFIRYKKSDGTQQSLTSITNTPSSYFCIKRPSDAHKAYLRLDNLRDHPFDIYLTRNSNFNYLSDFDGVVNTDNASLQNRRTEVNEIIKYPALRYSGINPISRAYVSQIGTESRPCNLIYSNEYISKRDDYLITTSSSSILFKFRDAAAQLLLINTEYKLSEQEYKITFNLSKNDEARALYLTITTDLDESQIKKRNIKDVLGIYDNTLTFNIYVRGMGLSLPSPYDISVDDLYTGLNNSNKTYTVTIFEDFNGINLVTFSFELNSDQYKKEYKGHIYVDAEISNNSAHFNLAISKSLVPRGDNTGISLGQPNYWFTNAYINTIRAITIYGAINPSSSDLRIKHDVQELTDVHDKLFDSLLPKSYRFNDLPNQLHYGFIALDIVKSMQELGLNDKGLYLGGDENDDLSYYSLCYNDFIALCVRLILKLKADYRLLEDKLKLLTEK